MKCLSEKAGVYGHYRNAKLFSKRDIVILAAVLLLAAVSVVLLFVFPEGSRADIYFEGELYASYSLNQKRTVELNGGKIVIEIDGGKVAVTENDCKDQICVRTGYISRVNERIVCLPYRLTVVIRGKGGVDEITGGIQS